MKEKGENDLPHSLGVSGKIWGNTGANVCDLVTSGHQKWDGKSMLSSPVSVPLSKADGIHHPFRTGSTK